MKLLVILALVIGLATWTKLTQQPSCEQQARLSFRGTAYDVDTAFWEYVEHMYRICGEAGNGR